ncbi:BTAD domain-containing putative transcriptional regulator [Streptomyces sp. NPDC001193]
MGAAHAPRTRPRLPAAGPDLAADERGYALHTPPESVDAWRFEERAEAARRARARGDAAAEHALLAEALGQWSGEALAGVPGPFAEEERIRLTALRTSARKRHIVCALRLGLHHTVIPELSALTREFPLDEELRALLMRALHGCGRQAEAFTVFADTHRTLREELGVAPCPELTALHARLLADDPPPFDLHRPSPLARAHGRTALPDAAERVLARAKSVLIGGQDRGAVPVLVITGPGRAGKTALAARVADGVAGKGEDFRGLFEPGPGALPVAGGRPGAAQEPQCPDLGRVPAQPAGRGHRAFAAFHGGRQAVPGQLGGRLRHQVHRLHRGRAVPRAQFGALPVAVDRLVGAAQVAGGESQVVQGVRLAALVPRVDGGREGGPADLGGLLAPAQAQQGADAVRAGVAAGPVAPVLLGGGDGLPVQGVGLEPVRPVLADVGPAVEDPGVHGFVAHRPRRVFGGVQDPLRLVRPSQVGQCAAEQVACAAGRSQVPLVLCGPQDPAQRFEGVGPQVRALQERFDGQREVGGHGHGRRHGFEDLRGDGERAVVVRIDEAQAAVGTAGAGARGQQPDDVVAGALGGVDGAGLGEQVVEEAGHGRRPLLGPVLLVGALGREHPEQGVLAVDAGAGRFEQTAAGQPLQELSGARR